MEPCTWCHTYCDGDCGNAGRRRAPRAYAGAAAAYSRPYSPAEEAQRATVAPTAPAAEWDKETTIARRAEWNALVRSGALSLKNGNINPTLVAKQERAQGWTVGELRGAVALHAL